MGTGYIGIRNGIFITVIMSRGTRAVQCSYVPSWFKDLHIYLVKRLDSCCNKLPIFNLFEITWEAEHLGCRVHLHMP